jgi:hypothetical protein
MVRLKIIIFILQSKNVRFEKPPTSVEMALRLYILFV